MTRGVFASSMITLLRLMFLLVILICFVGCNAMQSAFHYRWGNLSFNRGDLGNAHVEYGWAIHFDEDYAKAHAAEGKVYHLEGDIVKALEFYHKSLKLDLRDKELLFEVHTNLANIYQDQRKDALVEKHIFAAFRVRPDKYKRLWQHIRDQFSRKEYAKARDNIEVATSVSEGEYDLEVLRTKIYIELHDLAQAEERISEALASEPSRPEAEIEQARIDLYRGNIAEAELRLTDLAERFSFDVNAHYYLGVVYDLQGKRVEALKSYKKALTLANEEKASPALIRVLETAVKTRNARI